MTIVTFLEFLAHENVKVIKGRWELNVSPHDRKKAGQSIKEWFEKRIKDHPGVLQFSFREEKYAFHFALVGLSKKITRKQSIALLDFFYMPKEVKTTFQFE